MGDTARLLVECEDATGVIASVASAVAASGGNIVDADQHTDGGTRRFFMRVVFEPGGTRGAFEAAFEGVRERHAMRTSLRWPGGEARRLAILCSRQTHCVSDLLWRWSNGEFADAEIAYVLSNHDAARDLAGAYGVGFECLPVTPETKREQEAAIEQRLAGLGVDLVVLARYMQILSPAMATSWAGRVINIHHSFLPAFAGAKPYHQAFERGVKVIGATSHYVTSDLDEGPIIAQGVAPVTHRDAVEDLVRKGRDLERVVLAEAVRLHLEDKVLVTGNKTVVFS